MLPPKNEFVGADAAVLLEVTAPEKVEKLVAVLLGAGSESDGFVALSLLAVVLVAVAPNPGKDAGAVDVGLEFMLKVKGDADVAGC